jgi:hypothetical protein
MWQGEISELAGWLDDLLVGWFVGQSCVSLCLTVELADLKGGGVGNGVSAGVGVGVGVGVGIHGHQKSNPGDECKFGSRGGGSSRKQHRCQNRVTNLAQDVKLTARLDCGEEERRNMVRRGRVEPFGCLNY